MSNITNDTSFYKDKVIKLLTKIDEKDLNDPMAAFVISICLVVFICVNNLYGKENV